MKVDINESSQNFMRNKEWLREGKRDGDQTQERTFWDPKCGFKY